MHVALALARATNPRLGWNLVADLRELLAYPFMVHAFQAGTLVALAAGSIGWFVVLRRQTFAAHTLAVAGFPGGAGAVLVGLPAAFGFFGFSVGAALLIAAIPRVRGSGRQQETAAIGTVQAVVLAFGFLFVSLYGGNLNTINSLLFGSFLGITSTEVLALAAVTVAALALLAAIGRPLLFGSLDPDVAAARGVPVRWLSVVFLVLAGVAVAEAAQITGVLLVFALLVLPAAAAERLTLRPVASFLATVGFAVLAAWVGLAGAYYSPWPVGFWITSVAFATYLLARLAERFGHARGVVAAAG